MNSAKKLCPVPGCCAITSGGRCAKHKHTHKSKNRSGDPFYNSRPWKRLRAAKLLASPMCECDDCKVSGALVPASVVDHIKPRCDYPELELDYDNLRSMSERHHNRRTARDEMKKRGGGVV